MKSNKLVAYAGDFASFLIENIGETAKINQIILFGSAAKGEARKESDVDVFVDADEKIEAEVHKIVARFYKSIKVTQYWRLLGIENEIQCIVGDLEKWDLKRSIISNGIVLYGKYKGKPNGRGYALFKIKLDKNRSEQVRLWRALYGYKQSVSGKAYISEGLVKECGGKKLANSVFIIPLERSSELLEFLRKNKFGYELSEVWSDML